MRYPSPSGGHGSIAGFRSRKAAQAYAEDLESDRRHGRWLDPKGAKTTVDGWAAQWEPTHVLPRWGYTALGDITALEVTAWLKDPRERLAASTVAGILTVFSMMLDDAVDQRLVSVNPVHRRRRRGRRRDHAPSRVEKVFAMPEHVWRIAEQTAMLGGPAAGLLVITAAWTGCRWGELAGLWRDHIDLDRGVIVIDPEFGAPHESARGLWLGPPKTPASARTITLPAFLIELLRDHLAITSGGFVFTSPLGCRLRRSTFDRRVFRPAVDGNPRKRTQPVRPGLTFHGLRHSHKTWLIADKIPEMAQAQRLGHHLSKRLAETYSHVAPEIHTTPAPSPRATLAPHAPNPAPHRNRPRRKPIKRAPHTAPALRTTPAPVEAALERSSPPRVASPSSRSRRRNASRTPPSRCTHTIINASD